MRKVFWPQKANLERKRNETCWISSRWLSQYLRLCKNSKQHCMYMNAMLDTLTLKVKWSRKVNSTSGLSCFELRRGFFFFRKEKEFLVSLVVLETLSLVVDFISSASHRKTETMDPVKLDDSLEEFVKWLSEQKELPQSMPSILLVRYLKASNFNLDRAKSLLRNSLKWRHSYPHIFTQRDPHSKEMRNVINIV